ncbi:MAG: FecR domain-containing protein [Bacteroidota bacterium]
MKDNYTTYQAEDFAQDDSFIGWVKGTDETAVAFWEEWQKQHPERQADLEAARQLVLAIRLQVKEPPKAKLDDLWKRIDDEIDTVQVQQPARRRSLRWISYAAAACVAALLFVWLGPFDGTTSIRSDQQSVAMLPDGSRVQLNAVSEINYVADEWPQERRLSLEGEAFFEVKKGSRFQVNTALGSVEVLGTSFNVFARDDIFEVHCVTGRVQVRLKNGDAKVLNAGQSTRLTAQSQLAAPTPADGLRRAAWREGYFYFDDLPLQRSFSELERQFGIKIEASDALREKTSKVYFDNIDPDSAVNQVCWTVRLKVEKKGSVYRLTKK